MSEATIDDFMSLMGLLKNSSPPKNDYVLVTGLYGYYNFEFSSGRIGFPFDHVKHYIQKTHIVNYIYITLGHKFSNIKCKIRMGRDVSKIEVMNGVNTLFFSNHFDDVYKELDKLGIKIMIYNKFKKIYEFV